MSQPTIETRPAQDYAGITVATRMDNYAEIADRIPELFAWLGAQGIAPAGPPFFRYLLIDLPERVEVEVGVPVAEPVTGDGRVGAAILPAGRYVTVTHVGHPDGLPEVTGAMMDWAEQQGLEWDRIVHGETERWVGRVETYKTDPSQQPDMDKWETELAFKLAG